MYDKIHYNIKNKKKKKKQAERVTENFHWIKYELYFFNINGWTYSL